LTQAVLSTPSESTLYPTECCLYTPSDLYGLHRYDPSAFLLPPLDAAIPPLDAASDIDWSRLQDLLVTTSVPAWDDSEQQHHPSSSNIIPEVEYWHPINGSPSDSIGISHQYSTGGGGNIYPLPQISDCPELGYGISPITYYGLGDSDVNATNRTAFVEGTSSIDDVGYHHFEYVPIAVNTNIDFNHYGAFNNLNVVNEDVDVDVDFTLLH
jgi:hypothetical protein